LSSFCAKRTREESVILLEKKRKEKEKRKRRESKFINSCHPSRAQTDIPDIPEVRARGKVRERKNFWHTGTEKEHGRKHGQ